MRVDAHDLHSHAMRGVDPHLNAILGEAVLVSIHCLAFLSMPSVYMGGLTF